MPRAVGERPALLSIQVFQYAFRLLWLHLPQEGTRFAISEMYPVGRRFSTMGRRWSHSVARFHLRDPAVRNLQSFRELALRQARAGAHLHQLGTKSCVFRSEN